LFLSVFSGSLLHHFHGIRGPFGVFAQMTSPSDMLNSSDKVDFAKSWPLRSAATNVNHGAPGIATLK
jgi:hypothetical protein